MDKLASISLKNNKLQNIDILYKFRGLTKITAANVILSIPIF